MNEANSSQKVLMIGPGRSVRGGISTVVNSYFELGLNEKVELRYISSMEDGSKLKKLLVATKAYLEFKNCLKDYDIVHIHMAAQASFTRKSVFIRLAKKKGKKIIIHQHAADFDDFFFKQCNEKKRNQIIEIFGMADVVIVLSEEWEQFFSRNICKAEKIIVCHNGVVLPTYQKIDYSDHNVLFLGRLGKRKGTYDLLDVIPEILNVIPDAMFYLGGDGEVEQCRDMVEKKGIAEHVIFLGWIREAEREEYLKMCSIFVLPSYHEGMPMSVLEAMSYGLATISTNAGGIPQIIEQGENGYRVEAGDLRELADKLIKLLKNKQEKKRIGNAARVRIIEKFNAQKNVDRLCKIYCELVKYEG